MGAKDNPLCALFISSLHIIYSIVSLLFSSVNQNI
uniref:Uncharacterized protein n=1 Tax=Microviridae sp. ct6ut1 TaxID=2824986 RepID=A0A8S5UQ01_9VIRU|nr:MAG TPA: hypothetical protein [Microviridae sp. ct6ut1]